MGGDILGDEGYGRVMAIRQLISPGVICTQSISIKLEK